MSRDELMATVHALAILSALGVYLVASQVAGWIQEVRRWAGR